MIPTKCDFSLEFGHSEFSENCVFDRDSIITSSLLAKDLVRELRTRKYSYSTCILVDDKIVKPHLRADCPFRLLKLVNSYLRPDFIAFESNLKRVYLEMLDNIQSGKRKTVQKKLERYIRSRGSLACSHDISIWYMLRSGLVEVDQELVFKYTAAGRPRENSVFYGQRIVSILPLEMRKHERLADKEILQYINPTLNLLDHVIRFYYDSQKLYHEDQEIQKDSMIAILEGAK
jgi:hypothetical protein